VSCCELACSARLAWDIFLDALVISFKYLMIIYSGIIFDCHLVIPPLAVFLLSLCLQVPKGKEEEKKERICVVLGTNTCIFSILYCNILSIHYCNLLLFIPWL
jgi:hypothetical protein